MGSGSKRQGVSSTGSPPTPAPRLRRPWAPRVWLRATRHGRDGRPSGRQHVGQVKQREASAGWPRGQNSELLDAQNRSDSAAQPAVAADGLLGLRSRSPQLNVKYVRSTEYVVAATVSRSPAGYRTSVDMNSQLGMPWRFGESSDSGQRLSLLARSGNNAAGCGTFLSGSHDLAFRVGRPSSWRGFLGTLRPAHSRRSRRSPMGDLRAERRRTPPAVLPGCRRARVWAVGRPTHLRVPGSLWADCVASVRSTENLPNAGRSWPRTPPTRKVSHFARNQPSKARSSSAAPPSPDLRRLTGVRLVQRLFGRGCDEARSSLVRSGARRLGPGGRSSRDLTSRCSGRGRLRPSLFDGLGEPAPQLNGLDVRSTGSKHDAREEESACISNV